MNYTLRDFRDIANHAALTTSCIKKKKKMPGNPLPDINYFIVLIYDSIIKLFLFVCF